MATKLEWVSPEVIPACLEVPKKIDNKNDNGDDNDNDSDNYNYTDNDRHLR